MDVNFNGTYASVNSRVTQIFGSPRLEDYAKSYEFAVVNLLHKRTKQISMHVWEGHSSLSHVDAVSLADFIDIFMGEPEDPSSPSPSPLIGYMAQHQLLSQVPQIADGIP